MSWIHALARRRVPIGLAVVAAAMAVSAFVALDPLASSHATSGEAAGPNLASTVGVFGSAQASEDALPAALQETAMARLGAAVDSRKALVAANGTTVYLAAAEKSVCLLASNLSLAPCYTLEEIAHGATASSDSCSPSVGAGTIEIGGIVPSDATDPVVVLNNGSTRPLDVAGNAYLETFPKDGPLPAEIAWKSSSGGSTTVNVGIPAGAATEQCVASPSEVEALVAKGKIPPPAGHSPAQPTLHAEHNQAG